MTDVHIFLTENGVRKARSLHRVPPEERFVISEKKKVRGLPWNGRAENLKATIVTQQDQGPSGHRHVYLTTRVVARHGTTPGCSGCVGLGPCTEACRVLLEKALADADPVEARACHLVPRFSTGAAGASVFIIRSCCADANTRPSERANGFTDGVGSTRTQRAQQERGQARRQQVKSLEDQWRGQRRLQ